TAVVAEARELGDAQTLASALIMLSKVKAVERQPVQAEPLLREGLTLAAQADDGDLEADGWIQLVGVYNETSRFEQALLLGQAVDVAVARIGTTPRRVVRAAVVKA